MLLLDTCIVYDWLMGALRDPDAIRLVQATGAYASPVSVWEMAIKHRLGKLDLPAVNLAEAIAEQGFAWLNVTPQHAQTVLTLEDHHRDPFDRLLIAQAQCESMRVLTYDAVFRSYLGDTLIVRR